MNAITPREVPQGIVHTVPGISGAVMVLNERPPVFDSVCAAFNIIPRGAVFSYGDRVYSPDHATLPDHLIAHEMVHLRQQEYTEEGAILWWGKFLRDPEFRLSQEIEAYAHQYQYFKSRVADRNAPVKFLWALAQSMSGPLYNNCISHYEAMQRIKNHKKVTL